MTISTATLLGLFALLAVVAVCVAWVVVNLINARVRVEQERAEAAREVAYHLERAEAARVEAARYAVTLSYEQRVIAEADRRQGVRHG